VRRIAGTELFEPLRAAVEEPISEGITRQIFMLTDGEVSDEQDIIRWASSAAQQVTMFTVRYSAHVELIIFVFA
jgi:hypothetical protein